MSSRMRLVADAVVAKLEAGETAGAFSRAIATTAEWLSNETLETITDEISVMVVPVASNRRRESNGTFTRDVRIEIYVRKNDVEPDVVSDYFSMLEEIDDYLADPDNQEIDVTNGIVYVEPDAVDADRELVRNTGIWWAPKDLGANRFTGLVVCVYQVTANY